MRGEFLDLSGARLYYYAAGTRGAGNPIVLIHGFPTSSHLWNDVVPLMPTGHRLVVVDLLGYGRSDRPLGRAVDIASHADRVAALLDELHVDRTCVVGHGMGGGVAQSLALRHPHRVSHLCVVDGIAIGGVPLSPMGLARSTIAVMQLLPPGALLTVLRRKLLRRYGDPVRAARSVDLYLRPFAGRDGRDALVAHLRAARALSQPHASTRAANIAAPTSIVWGGQDREIPASVGERLRDEIPGAALTVLPGVGHFTPEEAPRELADAIGLLMSR